MFHVDLGFEQCLGFHKKATWIYANVMLASKTLGFNSSPDVQLLIHGELNSISMSWSRTSLWKPWPDQWKNKHKLHKLPASPLSHISTEISKNASNKRKSYAYIMACWGKYWLATHRKIWEEWENWAEERSWCGYRPYLTF